MKLVAKLPKTLLTLALGLALTLSGLEARATAYVFRVSLAGNSFATTCSSPGDLELTTPGTQTVVIPAGCAVDATVFGGDGGWGGGGGSAPGGLGSKVEVQLPPATSSQTLTVTIGLGGTSSGSSSSLSTAGAYGGGYSSLQKGGAWLVVAGGGGGGGGPRGRLYGG